MVVLARPPVASKDVGGGDDLADDFELDAHLLADAGDGDLSSSDEAAGSFSEPEDEVFKFDSVEQDDGLRDVRSGRGARKRKARELGGSGDDDDDEHAADNDEVEGGDAAAQGDDASAPREAEKKKKKKKAKRPRLSPSTSTSGSGIALALAGPAELAAWWAGVLRAEGTTKGLSGLELEEAGLPEGCFEDTAAFAEERTVGKLPQFVQERVPKLATRIAQRPKNPGAPTGIILCASALRATEVCRVLKASPLRGEKGGEVAKLFAKHFKLQQHVAYLSRTRISLAVATPARLAQLLAADALSLSALSHLVLDESYRDAKERTLCAVPEVRGEVVGLMRGKLGEKVRGGGVKVVVY